IDEQRSRNPWRILCEIYAKLIGQVILHWMLLTQWHRFPDRSLYKAAKALQKLALPLALALQRGEGLKEIATLFHQCLRQAGRLNKRRSRPATFQLVLALEGP
ncbi:MAG: IS4/IS5 family transposase, partial [Anaerolineae bacterium]